MPYEIAKFNDVFVKSDNVRAMKAERPIPWCSHPNTFTSRGYHQLLDSAASDLEGMAIYGVFCQLVKLSAQGKPYGVLAHSDGSEFTVRYMARTVGIDSELVERAIKTLVAVGWLAGVGTTAGQLPDNCGTTAGQNDGSCPPTEQDRTGQNKTGQDRGAENPPSSANADPSPQLAASMTDTETEVLAAFNATFGTSCRWTKKRRDQLRQRMRHPDWRNEWRAALRRAGPSAFLRGSNDRGWMIDLEFFLRPDTVTKILEGKYDGRNATNSETQRENSNAAAFDAVFGDDNAAGDSPGVGNALLNENSGEFHAAPIGDVGGHIVDLPGGNR